MTGLDIAESTLATSRTTGKLGGVDAPPFVVIAQKPYYRHHDIVNWLDGLYSAPCNALHQMTA